MWELSASQSENFRVFITPFTLSNFNAFHVVRMNQSLKNSVENSYENLRWINTTLFLRN